MKRQHCALTMAIQSPATIFEGSKDPLLQRAARFAGHPDFDRAVATYCVGLAKFREAPRFVNMIVSADVRWRIIGFVLYLHADRERFGPEGGATYSRLLELCMRRGEASPRMVKSLLALLQVFGLIHRASSKSDRRLKIYQPTERMDVFLREWMRYGAAALDILEPEIGRSEMIGDPDFVARFCVSGGRAHLEDPVPLADRVPAPLSSLKSMLGNYSVIFAVLLASLQGTPTPSRHSIARRYGLSKSQVGNIVLAGQEHGLFTFDKAANLIPTIALHDSFREWVSIELAFYAHHMQPVPMPSPSS